MAINGPSAGNQRSISWQSAVHQLAINGPSAGNQRSISWQSTVHQLAIKGQSVLITCAAPPDAPLYEGGASGRSPLAPTRRAPVRARRARPRRRASSPHGCERTCDREANPISRNQSQSVAISRNQSQSGRTCDREANQLQSVVISTNRHQSARITRNESAAISRNQPQPVAISRNQLESAAISRNQSQSAAISRNQSLSLDGGRAVLKQQRERIVTEEQAHLHATPSALISGNCNGRAGSPACNAISAHQW